MYFVRAMKFRDLKNLRDFERLDFSRSRRHEFARSRIKKNFVLYSDLFTDLGTNDCLIILEMVTADGVRTRQ